MCGGVSHQEKKKLTTVICLTWKVYMLPEKLHFIGVAESDELLLKMPVTSFPSSSHWQVMARHRFNLPLCLGRHKPPSTWQMLLPWCYLGSPSNPPVGALLLGLNPKWQCFSLVVLVFIKQIKCLAARAVPLEQLELFVYGGNPIWEVFLPPFCSTIL